MREILEGRIAPSVRKMFGGLTFIANGHVRCGVIKEDLVLRLAPEMADEARSDLNSQVPFVPFT